MGCSRGRRTQTERQEPRIQERPSRLAFGGPSASHTGSLAHLRAAAGPAEAAARAPAAAVAAAEQLQHAAIEGREAARAEQTWSTSTGES